MHTSLKGGEHVVLSFSCQRVNFAFREFRNGFCRVFGLSIFNTSNQTNQRGGP